MSTLDILLDKRVLTRVVVKLARGQFHDRKLYALPECLEWMRNEVPKMATGRIQSAQTPAEQLTERLRQWMADEPMRFGPWFHDMNPRSDDVWELKTDDLRLFGWMYRPKEFIAVRGGYADHYKGETKIKTYADERRHVVSVRAALPLDPPKHVSGEFDDLV